MPTIYTRKGDDGSTGLLHGGRVAKDAPRIEVNGSGGRGAGGARTLARAERPSQGPNLDERLLVASRARLYVLMAEVATSEKEAPGTS